MPVHARTVAILTLALVAAGASPAPADQPTGQTVKVEISKLAFVPAEITVHIGDTVEWTNNDFIDHTATSKTGTSPWEVLLPVAKSASVQLMQAGTIDYICRFHPNMMGKIIVLAN